MNPSGIAACVLAAALLAFSACAQPTAEAQRSAQRVQAHVTFLASCYHRPCDDLSQPIDYAAGAKFARINYEIAREIADADERPKWNKGDFFGGKFAAPAAIADR